MIVTNFLVGLPAMLLSLILAGDRRLLERPLLCESGISFNGTSLPWYPIICDLCDGDPACACICLTEAITVDERRSVK